MAKKKAKKAPQKWVDIPQREFWSWASDWIVASMVLEAYKKGKEKMPKRISVPENCLEDQPDGSALLHFDVQY